MNTHTESSVNEPKYRGVRKRKWGKWVSEIRMPNSRERIWLGSYDSPEKAARAFDAATYCLRGHAARLNFPDHPPNIPGATSLSSSEIQAVAARFANSVPDDAVVPMQQQEEHIPAVSASETTSSLVNLHDNINDAYNNNVMGYDIFPGFDDYFMQPPPMVSTQLPDYAYEQNSNDGDISQLWNY
ncbi:hypothetical protein QVD17_22432 [Tagetes erecta]|uniref:AP2/ERF domain-containing protein n=1 Tax=Tagetes erecta TaxID=13708 RepID=A0AAD8NLR0_TARER|nr:hypothetical protein QVD17_22432 [Tagetes erecta]